MIGIHTRDQSVKPPRRQSVRNATEHAQEKWIGNLLMRNRIARNNDANRAVLAATQIFSANIDRVVQRFCKISDARARFWINQFAAIQGARYRGRRNSRQPSQVDHLQSFSWGDWLGGWGYFFYAWFCHIWVN